MYLDERIHMTVSIDVSMLSLVCGSCVLIRLVKETDHFHLNKELNRESHHYDFPSQFIGLVVDMIDTPFFLLNTYLNTTPIQSHYELQIEGHPCPVLPSREPQEFLFCTDQLCHTPHWKTTNLSVSFRDYYNPYYTTIHPRNLKYPFISIQLYYFHYPSQRQEYLQIANDLTGYLLPSTIQEDRFFLLCMDRQTTFTYEFSFQEIMETTTLDPSHYGGIRIRKYPLSSTYEQMTNDIFSNIQQNGL